MKNLWNPSKAVFAIFHLPVDVKKAKIELLSEGFPLDSISILQPPIVGAQNFSQSYKTSISKGAIYGAIVGSTVFIFFGIIVTTQKMNIPVLEAPLYLIEPILLLAIIVLCGTVFGAAAGALIGIGTPESVSHRYSDYVSVGGVLMSVHVNSTEDRRLAEEIMERNFGLDISTIKESESWNFVLESVFLKHA